MTKLLDRAIESVRQLPEDEQNDLAGFLLALRPDEALTAEDRAAIAEADLEFERGNVLAGDELKAFWKKLGQ